MTREETLNVAMDVIGKNPNAPFLIVIDSDAGLMTYTSTDRIIWLMGLVKALKRIVDIRFAQIISTPQPELEARVMNGVKQALEDSKKAGN